MKFVLTGISFVLALIVSDPVMAGRKVIYPNVNGAGKSSFGYSVLKLALENSGQEAELEVLDSVVNNDRIRCMIKSGRISISDFGTSIEYERDLRPIHFPIDMGLNGYRLLLVHRDTVDQYQNITTKVELAQKEVGQGTGWSDTIILENAGFKVVQAPLLENLFGMIQFKRFDCFPLGANEAHALLERYRQDCPDVIIEPRLLIRYPFGRLFFVNKNDGELHDMVKTGLITAFNNGSFWKLFRSHGSNAGLFTRANIKDRVQIEISNTNLTEEFKTIPDKYFFSLDMLD